MGLVHPSPMCLHDSEQVSTSGTEWDRTFPEAGAFWTLWDTLELSLTKHPGNSPEEVNGLARRVGQTDSLNFNLEDQADRMNWNGLTGESDA